MEENNGYLPGYQKGKGQSGLNLEWWREQIKAGIKWRDQWTHSNKWGLWDAYYRNDQEQISTFSGLADPLTINLFFIMARSFVPRVYFRNPSVSVTPSKPGPEQLGLAMLHERLYNKLMKQMRMKNQMRSIVNKGFFRGTFVSKLGYGSQFAPIEHAAANADSALVKGGGNLEYKADLDIGMPWLAPVETEHYVLPVGTVDKRSAPWEVHIVFRPSEELKLDERMKNRDSIVATHDSTVQAGEPILTETWEVHDRRTQKVFIMTPGGTDSMDSPAVLFGPIHDAMQSSNGGPMHAGVFNENLGLFWGLPDGAVLEPLQEEITEITTQMSRHRKMTLIKFLISEGALTPEQAAALVSGDLDDIGAAIMVKEPGGVSDIRTGSVPPELIQAFDKIMEIVRLTFGFSRNQFGEFQPGSEKPTARETHAVQQAATIRVDERRDVMADYLVEVLEDTGRLIHNHWTEERVEQVVGPFGVPIWVKFSGEMLKGAKFELNVDPDAGLPVTKELREARAKETFQTLYPLSQVPDAQLGRPLIDSVKLARFLLHETQGVAYDDMLMGVPNIYDEQFTRALMLGTEAGKAPISPGELGQIQQNAGPAGQVMAQNFPNAGQGGGGGA